MRRLFNDYIAQKISCVTLEAASAIIKQALHNADIDHLVAITTSDNIRTIAILTKLGFVFERVEEVINESVNLNLYGFSLGN